ncbi:MAG: response regulator [Elusimicrobia bacterium]|nr:response regulator [Elusimicrobiota bacterium]
MSKDAIYVLHVEDNPDDVELTRIAFKEAGFPHKVVVVNDGAAALDFLFATGKHEGRDKGDTPALILLDLNLPKVHGLEVLRRLKADALLKHVLVVVLTSSSEDKDRNRAAELGTNLYIQKPISFDSFAAVARKVEELLAAL